MARFTYIWEFEIAPSAPAQFEFEYGPRGAWVALFRTASVGILEITFRAAVNPSRATRSTHASHPLQTPLVACDQPLFFTLRPISSRSGTSDAPRRS